MISLCILTKDESYIAELINMFGSHCNCDFEVCIGHNVSKEDPDVKRLANEYILIPDKELFRMGIPWAHERIIAQANTYKICYIDGDEFPVWIAPDLEDRFDLNYVPKVLRYDFFTMDEIREVDRDMKFHYKGAPSEVPLLKHKEVSVQDRFLNSRYARFQGLCHAIFHVPQHFRGMTPSAILLHRETPRDDSNKERMRDIIREQKARSNINPFLASSNQVLQWGRGEKHKYESWEDWKKAYE